MTDFRSREDGSAYPIDSGADSGLDEAVENVVNPKPPVDIPGICSFCGSGAQTVKLPNGREVCESCFLAHFDEISAQLKMSEDELMEVLKTESPSTLTPASQPSRTQSNSEAGKCSRCGYVFPTGPGSSGSHTAHYRQAHPDMLA